MGKLWNWLASVGGDTHFVRSWCIPPNIQIGLHEYKIDLGRDYRMLSLKLRPGDVLVSRVNGYFLSNNAIPGGFKHAMFYVGPVRGWRDPETGFIHEPKLMPSGCSVYHTDHPRCIVHAVSEGVVCQDILDVMTHTDYMAAFRPTYEQNGASNGEKASVTAMENIGKPYDFDFDFTTEKSLCCTELVEWSLLKSGFNGWMPKRELKPTVFSKRIDVLLADDFASVFPMVWCSSSCRDGYISKKTPSIQLKLQLSHLTQNT